MARLASRLETDLQQETLDKLEPLRNGGKLAPVYYQMANSEHALVAYLGLENAIARSGLDSAEIEAIKLCLSELNRCDFCLSVHTVKAAKVGLDKDAQLAVRQGVDTGNARIDAIVSLVRGFIETPGTIPAAKLADLRDCGFSDQDLVDIVLVVSTMFLTNTFNHINDTELVFPKIPALS